MGTENSPIAVRCSDIGHGKPVLRGVRNSVYVSIHRGRNCVWGDIRYRSNHEEIAFPVA